MGDDVMAMLIDRLDEASCMHAAPTPKLPFGGMKWSGPGVENRRSGYLSSLDVQVVNRAKTP